MRDQIEQLEDCAERQFDDQSLPDGMFKCGCGNSFDPDSEGGPLSPSPYAMPVCGRCLTEAIEEMEGNNV